MAKKKSKPVKKLSAKSRGKVWGGLRSAGRSMRACVAVLKNKKSSKAAKAKASKRLNGAAKAIRKFQGLLGLKQKKWTGIVAKHVKD